VPQQYESYIKLQRADMVNRRRRSLLIGLGAFVLPGFVLMIIAASVLAKRFEPYIESRPYCTFAGVSTAKWN
jgi:hypothetical protein